MKKNNNGIIEKSVVYLLICFSIFVILASFADTIVRPDHVTLTEYSWGILLVGGGFICIYQLVLRVSEECMRKVFVLLSVFVFALYIVEVWEMQLRPEVDLSHIIKQSLDMIEKGTHEFTNEKYFSFYTNNIPIAIVIYWVFYIGELLWKDSFNYSIAGGLFNVLMIWIGFLCFFKLVDKLTSNKKTGYFFKILMLCNPLFFVYASYYYTDTVAISLSIAAMLGIVTACQSDGIKKYLCLFGAGILLAIAVKIRVVALFILLAFVVGLLHKRYGKELIRLMVVFSIAFFIVEFAYGAVCSYHVKFNTNEKAVPITHFLMMGSHDHGTFCSEDVKFTKSFKDPEQREKKTREAYCKNLKKNGLVGNIKLLIEKEAVWGIGTRGYYQYTKNVKKETFLYHLIAGKYQGITKGVLQAYNLAIIAFACLGLLYSRKNMAFIQLVLLIYWGGAIVFTALWEAHPRHIMTYIPLISLIGIPFGEMVFPKDR